MLLGPFISPILLSFNRYMVECELVMQSLRLRILMVLIDTWWNVNLSPNNLYNAGARF